MKHNGNRNRKITKYGHNETQEKNWVMGSTLGENNTATQDWHYLSPPRRHVHTPHNIQRGAGWALWRYWTDGLQGSTCSGTHGGAGSSGGHGGAASVALASALGPRPGLYGRSPIAPPPPPPKKIPWTKLWVRGPPLARRRSRSPLWAGCGNRSSLANLVMG